MTAMKPGGGAPNSRAAAWMAAPEKVNAPTATPASSNIAA